MQQKAQVVDLISTSDGLEKVYDVSEKELQMIMKKHRGKVNGSNGSYAIYDKAVPRLYLHVYIKESLKTVKIDIRPKVIAFSGFARISKQFRLKLKQAFPKTVMVEIGEDGKWALSDPNVILSAVVKAANMM